MREREKTSLVDKASSQLQISPFDKVHDLLHHKLVWGNCQEIIKAEKLGTIDMDCLMVSALWHDVQRGQSDEFALLKQILKEENISDIDSQKILEITGSHSFGYEQKSLEAQILYDADKLEYVNFERAQILLDELNNGSIDASRFDDYVKAWRERIPKVEKQLHFAYSKELFEKRLKDLMKLASEVPQFNQFVQEIVL